MPKLKLAICIPCYADPELMFFKSLQDALCHFYEAKLTDPEGVPYEKEVKTFFVSSSMLAESRHRLLAEANLWGADFILCLDADHTFPCDAICRLWAHNRQIVGCNYARRSRPTAPTAAKIVTNDVKKDHKNLVYTTKEKAAAMLVEEVSHLGFGLCLLRADVFTQLQLHAESKGEKSMLPLFVFEPSPDGKGVIGEDVYFFRKCREAGIKVYLDHALSWDVGHIVKSVLSNAHCVSQEEAWIEQGREIGKRYEEKIKELEEAA